MKVTYDEKTDSLTVISNGKSSVAESDEDKPGVILDYDRNGNPVFLEVLGASRRVTEARKIEFQTTNSPVSPQGRRGARPGVGRPRGRDSASSPGGRSACHPDGGYAPDPRPLVSRQSALQLCQSAP